MPCAKGMVGCKRNCLHRQQVEEYRLARHAQILAEEERTLGGRGEREIERQNFIKPPITFREWLQGTARSQHDAEA